MSSIDQHIKHKYCAELFALPNGELLLQVPENRFNYIQKSVIKFVTQDDSITIENLAPVEQSRKFEVDRLGQAALINLYIAIEQLSREMNSELLRVYDTDMKQGQLYDVLDLNDEERTANNKLMISLLTGELPDESLVRNYNLIKNFIAELKNV